MQSDIGKTEWTRVARPWIPTVILVPHEWLSDIAGALLVAAAVMPANVAG